jgi:uncharacterized protein (TIGR00369 family)
LDGDVLLFNQCVAGSASGCLSRNPSPHRRLETFQALSTFKLLRLRQPRRKSGKNSLLAVSVRCLLPPVRELPHTHSCFVCGESNPLGLKLRFETDGRIVQARFRPRLEHIGFKNVVHGGLIATVLDEIMVWACAVQTRQFAFCAELNVRFVSPLPPGEGVIVTGELTANRNDRIFEAQAAVRNSQGQTLAKAKGKYLPIKTNDVAQMFADLVGDVSWIPGRRT